MFLLARTKVAMSCLFLFSTELGNQGKILHILILMSWISRISLFERWQIGQNWAEVFFSMPNDNFAGTSGQARFIVAK